MTFTMNDLKWTIRYATADEIKAISNDKNEDIYYFGSITLSTQEILINKEVSTEKQIEALYHELMHCYFYCFLCDGLQFNEEGLCDISAKSHNMIHRICEDFFKKASDEE